MYMKKDLIKAIVSIGIILKERYGLNAEESANCISQFNDMDLILCTDYNSLAERMYYKNEINKKITRNNDIVNEIIERKKATEAIVSNDEYINWLDVFTAKEKGFNDCDWVYEPESIGLEDLKKIKKLSLLLDVISDYADKNNIKIEPCGSGYYYHVKYNNFMFRLGVFVGQGGYCFCERINNENLDYIDFNDVMNSYKANQMQRELK